MSARPWTAHYVEGTRPQIDAIPYPHLADNPVTRLVRILDRLKAWHLDDGNAWGGVAAELPANTCLMVARDIAATGRGGACGRCSWRANGAGG